MPKVSPYPYQIGARLFAWMAYPVDPARREPAETALRHSFAMRLSERLGEDAKANVSLVDLRVDTANAEQALRRLERVLRDRAIAGHVGCAYLIRQDELQSGEGNRASWVTIERLAEREGLDPRVLRRKLAAAAPALQLCTAWTMTMQPLLQGAGPAPDIYDLIGDPQFLSAWIEMAMKHERLIVDTPGLEASAAKMLPLESQGPFLMAHGSASER